MGWQKSSDSGTPGKDQVADGNIGGRKLPHAIVVNVKGHTELLELIGALEPSGSLPRALDSRQKQRHKHADDGDRYQKLNNRECATASHVRNPLLSPTYTEFKVAYMRNPIRIRFRTCSENRQGA